MIADTKDRQESRTWPTAMTHPARADDTSTERATFMVLHDGRIHFEGRAAELRASRDKYLQEFLFMTLPPW